MSGVGVYRPSLDRFHPGGPIAGLIVNPSPEQIAAAAGLALGEGPQDWRDWAACAEVDAELFFPPKGGTARAAKKVCAACPVLADCNEWADAHPAESAYGVWAGMSERERQHARGPRHRKAAA